MISFHRGSAWLTIVIVLAGVIGIPGVRLFRHWEAVTALESSDAELTSEEPPFGAWLKCPWYSKLFGTVREVRFRTATVQDARQLRHLRGLTEIVIWEAPDEVWTQLPTNITKLYVYNSNRSRRLSSIAWSRVASMRKLESFTVSGDYWEYPKVLELDASAIQVLGSLKRLTTVSLDVVHLPTEQLRQLLELKPELRHLEISTSALTNADVEQISHHPGIEYLELNRNDLVTDDCMSSVATMKSLKVFATTPPETRLSCFGEECSSITVGGLTKLRAKRPDLKLTRLDEYSPAIMNGILDRMVKGLRDGRP